MKNGCYNIEWNGHFGRNIFFDVEEENVQKAKIAITRFVKILDNQ